MSTKAPKKSKRVRSSKRPDPNRTVKTVVVPFAKTQIITTKQPVKPPKKMNKRQQLVMSVIGSQPFQCNNANVNAGHFRLNPSNQALFPSLAYEAANYDKYRFTHLKVSYSPLVTVQQSGRISLMWDPDSQDVLPSSRVEIPEYSRAVSTAVYEACSLTIPTENKWLYVNDSNVVDRKQVDYGQVIVATHSGTNGVELGDVYLEYVVEFMYPQPSATMVQTGILDVGGGLTTTGPSYIAQADITYSATDLSIRSNLAGTFSITMVITCTTPGILNVGGNSTLIGSSRGGYGSGNFVAAFVFASTGVPSTTPSVSMSGMVGAVRFQYFITRASPRNALTTG
nr:capsid protein [Tombusviridae sp.]